MSRPPWIVRPAGSNLGGDRYTFEGVLEAVRDAVIDPADEVRETGTKVWTPLEAHPAFADAIDAMLPPTPIHLGDETHLDMNPLIDVALVLLIFFMLKTSVDFERKAIDLPVAQVDEKTEGKKQQVPQVTPDQLKQGMRIVARKEAGKVAIRIDDEAVREDALADTIRRKVEREKKKEAFLDTQGVPWGVEVAILDALAGAGVTDIMKRVRADGDR